jgi:hypothetical protein
METVKLKSSDGPLEDVTHTYARPEWRVGSKVKRNLYRGLEPVAMLATEEMAARIADGMNRARPATDTEIDGLLDQLNEYCFKASDREYRYRMPVDDSCDLPQMRELVRGWLNREILKK